MNSENVPAEKAEWIGHLWRELEDLDPETQFLIIGTWIPYITMTVLPELGAARRRAILALIDQEGLTVAQAASQLGMRYSSLGKLVDEGRAAEKHRRTVAAAAVA